MIPVTVMTSPPEDLGSSLREWYCPAGPATKHAPHRKRTKRVHSRNRSGLINNGRGSLGVQFGSRRDLRATLLSAAVTLLAAVPLQFVFRSWEWMVGVLVVVLGMTTI